MSDNSKHTSISIRLSKSEKILIEKEASQNSLGLSEYIRNVLFNKLRRARPSEKLLAEAIALFHQMQSPTNGTVNCQLKELRIIINDLIKLAKNE